MLIRTTSGTLRGAFPSSYALGSREMKFVALIRNRAAVLIHDVLAIPVAWFGAYWLRFNLDAIPMEFMQVGARVFPFVIVAQALCFWYFGLYRGIWRFASIPDVVRIIKAVVVGTCIAAAAIFLTMGIAGIPRSVFPIYGFLLLAFVGGPRLAYRWVRDRSLYHGQGKKALIVGAGRSGEMLVRDLLRDPKCEYEPLGFVDDDKKKQGKEIHGIRVIGGTENIGNLVSNVDVILLALPSASSKDMRRIVGICESTGVPFRTLPKIEDLVSGRATVSELRDVKIDDLLGREPVTLKWGAIRQSSEGRCVLVTGGGGSIGSELCRQIASLAPAKLIILEQNEFNLYSIDLELRRSFPKLRLVSMLGSVGDAGLVERMLQSHHPEVIFHAAAYKHVPMLEDQARSAVRNNILATRSLASLADKHGCESFVLISTDKAVNPSNVMGATKLVAESYCQSLNERSATQFITVRFGNVLGSTGSVVPLFQKQIAEGGPVTVTDPNVTRYFMIIPEAAQLILQASSVGHGGEIFVLDMGEPINIKYLAEQLILLSGKKPGEDIEIVYTGLRPGEKLYEELFHQAEALMPTPHPKTLLARSRLLDLAVAEREIDAMAQACGENDEPRLHRLLTKFVELASQDGQRSSAPLAQIAVK